MCTTLPSWLFYKIFINNVEFFMSRAWIGLLAFQTRCLRSFPHFVLLRFLVFNWVTLYSLGHCQQWRENWWVSVFFNNAAHGRQFASIILLPVGDFNLEITLISVSINFLFLNNRLWFYPPLYFCVVHRSVYSQIFAMKFLLPHLATRCRSILLRWSISVSSDTTRCWTNEERVCMQAV